MHIFPQLRKLEHKYAGELAVIGVHSAKFTAEKDSANLRKAVLRLEIEHPVVNDQDFEIWKQYSVRAWPTFMFIDPQGKLVGKHEGEISFEGFERVLDELVLEFDEQGLLDRRPIEYKLEREKEWERPLSFPGKVLAHESSGRLFIADSNHNRVVVSTLDGDVHAIIGSGDRGLADGPFEEARFDDPQGMELDGDALYVADTKNHAIRLVDLTAKTVKTIAGTGQQANGLHGGGSALSVSLNSPWDLTLHDGTLYIAMAGFHQLWKLDLAAGVVSPFSGNGRERITDGPHQSAELAQPSGTTTDGAKLYFTDSETSAIRSADLDAAGRVATIVGLHLFEFGDVDGVGDDVRLQHPIGIEMHDGVLFVADTYNNKIKKVFPVTRGATSYLGSGSPGHDDGPGASATFHEPAGLSVAAGKLYIADTNNHVIRIADLESGDVVTLELRGL